MITFLRAELARMKQERDEAIQSEKMITRAYTAAVGVAERLRGMLQVANSTWNNSDDLDTEAIGTEVDSVSKTLKTVYALSGIALET